ncbi:MAG TPA: hypothetical protein VGM90_01790 [Kofleriaceae bacterium]|jgi:hypothetical protein
MRTSQLVLRGALVAAMLPFTTAASCDGGDRADTGNCPDGEVCSAATPDGLHFQGGVIGEGFFDVGNVKVTALGGTQEVTIETENDAGDRAPFLLAHDLEVDSANIAIRSSNDNVFTMRGNAVGDAHVRVVDPQTGELFDRLFSSVAPIDHIETQMAVSIAFTTSFEQTGTNILYAPGATGYIRLVSANNGSLVDTSSHITGAAITQTGWDRFVVGNLPVGPHTLAVSAGAGTTASLPFEVAIPNTITGGPSALTQGVSTLACFIARRDTTPVHTHFDAITSSQATLEPSPYDGCVTVTAPAVGNVTIHVAAGALVADFVLPSRASSSARAAEPRAVATGTAGERAASLLTLVRE